LDYTSPVPNSIQPSSPACDQDDSPYLYEIRKKQTAPKFHTNGISTSSHRAIDETPLKRSGGSVKQRICLSSNIMEISDDDLIERSDAVILKSIHDVIFESSDDVIIESGDDVIIESSDDVMIESSDDVIMESPKSSAVMKIVEKVMDTEEEETLSGDFSQKCILPVIKGKHPELNTITTETVAWLLITDHDYDITIIDCRYPYEFCAGHIKSAINLYSKEKVDEDFFNSDVTNEGTQSKRLLIFYCEFSSERAPNM
ncbi:M-phase inducer phosphatase 3, partial [Araneus ventricosus]